MAVMMDGYSFQLKHVFQCKQRQPAETRSPICSIPLLKRCSYLGALEEKRGKEKEHVKYIMYYVVCFSVNPSN